MRSGLLSQPCSPHPERGKQCRSDAGFKPRFRSALFFWQSRCIWKSAQVGLPARLSHGYNPGMNIARTVGPALWMDSHAILPTWLRGAFEVFYRPLDRIEERSDLASH